MTWEGKLRLYFIINLLTNLFIFEMKKLLWVVYVFVFSVFLFIACDGNTNQEEVNSDVPLSESEEAEAMSMLDTVEFDSTMIDTLDIIDEEEED